MRLDPFVRVFLLHRTQRQFHPVICLGFSQHATGGFTLELTDESMPENSGRYGITRERVTVGGTAGPTVKCNERALAALYSGFTSARTLAQTGWLDADDDTLSLLDSWFAGPTPTMRDHF